MLFSLGELNVVLDKITSLTAKELVDNVTSSKGGYASRYDSVSKKAKDTIIQFPVLISSAVPASDMVMVSRALERQYATYVRLSAEMSSRTINSDQDRAEFLNNFSDRSLNSHRSDEEKVLGMVQAGPGRFVTESVEANNISQDVQHKLRLANLSESKAYFEDLRLKPLNDLYRPASKLSEAPEQVYRTREVNQRGSNFLTKQLVDNDIKKANELLPTTLTLEIKVKDSTGLYNEQILVGVKAISHLINSEEMVYNLATTAKGKRSFFRFIQWTTGEINFVRDYILDLERMKKMAVDTRKSHWFRSLYKRRQDRHLEKIRKAVGFKANGSSPLPTSTIVLTMDEVEYIMNNYNIDLLTDKKAVRAIMDQYLLLGFVILDPAAEMGYFLFDGDENYQTYGYSALEKESQGKTDMKAMLSLVNGR